MCNAVGANAELLVAQLTLRSALVVAAARGPALGVQAGIFLRAICSGHAIHTPALHRVTHCAPVTIARITASSVGHTALIHALACDPAILRRRTLDTHLMNRITDPEPILILRAVQAGRATRLIDTGAVSTDLGTPALRAEQAVDTDAGSGVTVPMTAGHLRAASRPTPATPAIESVGWAASAAVRNCKN